LFILIEDMGIKAYNIEMENAKTLNERIEDTIDKIRPFIRRDGGDLEFIGYEDGIVYIIMLGACVDCGLLDSTNDGIAMILMEEVAEVTDVKIATPEIIEKFRT